MNHAIMFEMNQAMDGTGRPVDPRDGVVPILREIDKGMLKVVGTGFYISRYGLFLSANHVIATLIGGTEKNLGVGYICYRAKNNTVHLRRILGAGLLQPADLAVGQVRQLRSEESLKHSPTGFFHDHPDPAR